MVERKFCILRTWEKSYGAIKLKNKTRFHSVTRKNIAPCGSPKHEVRDGQSYAEGTQKN